jgi:hypothetical protein
MSVVFEGLVNTAYAQLYLTTGQAEIPNPDDAFVGQANGLSGATTPGAVFLITATHTGAIPVRIVLLDDEPAPGEWEEIVDVSLVPDRQDASFSGWAGDPSATFELPAGSYRVRWSGRGMDAARDMTATEMEPALDAYELALWPAAIALDRIVRRTSAAAGYWHDGGFLGHS